MNEIQTNFILREDPVQKAGTYLLPGASQNFSQKD